MPAQRSNAIIAKTWGKNEKEDPASNPDKKSNKLSPLFQKTPPHLNPTEAPNTSPHSLTTFRC
jgi:hypothetical protein